MSKYSKKGTVEKRFIGDSLGYGLFAAKFMREGTIIPPKSNSGVVWTQISGGEIKYTAFGIRMKERLGGELGLIKLIDNYGSRSSIGDTDSVIVPEDKTKLGWWTANSSCVPNATLTRVIFDYEIKGLYITTLRDIFADEEITVNYGWNSKTKCLCGSKNCKGFI